MAKSSIEWTDYTFNIAWGCFKVSPGCTNCYAEGLAAFRYAGTQIWGPPKTTARRRFGAEHWAEPYSWNNAAARAGVRKHVFCSSMCDVFEDHPVITVERSKLWKLIRSTPWLDWQLLTKRPERIAANLPDDWGPGWHNVWLGTSVENQEYANLRVPQLLSVPANVHFVSVEPLLGPVDLSHVELLADKSERAGIHINALAGKYVESGMNYIGDWDIAGPCPTRAPRALSWVIVGGESGTQARPMQLTWAIAVRDQCARAGVAFFLKQLGGRANKRGGEAALLDGQRHVEFPDVAVVV